MNPSYLVHRKSGSSYLFRSVIPLDPQPILESRQFQLSLGCGILRQSKQIFFHLNQVTQSLYNSIRQNPEMKKLTISDIKDILRTELKKSKRHVQHYYLGTNRFSETDRLKSLLSNQEEEEQFREKLKQDYRQTLKELNPKVNQVLEQQGYDREPVDSLEFKQLREELIQLKLDQFEQKRILLSGELDNVEESVETNSPKSILPITVQQGVGSIKLSDLCDRFIKSREEIGSTPQTIMDYRNFTGLLLEILTDIPINSLTHQHGRKFVQTLKKLPKNINRYSDNNVSNLLEMKNVELLGDSTIRKIFTKIITLFNWSIRGIYHRTSSKGN